MPQNLGSDIELVYWEALKRGDESSFNWLYHQYFGILYNYGKKIGADNTMLEDAIHDLFVDLWRFHNTLSSTTSVRFYLYRSLRRRIMKNISDNAYFSSNGVKLRDVLEIITPSCEDDVIEEEKHEQRIHRLRKLLNDLSPRQYEAIVLRFYDDLSYPEIASILEVNEQSVRNLVQRGLVQLRQYAKQILPLLFLFMLI